MFIIKKVFSALLLGLFMVSSLESGEIPLVTVRDISEWSKFTSKENGFSIELPKTPDHVKQKIDIPKTDLTIHYDTYISEPSHDAVYVISVWYYPSVIDMSRPEVNLKDGFDGMLSALPGSKVEKMEMSTLNGFKTLEFLVKHDDIYFQGKLILVYNTLFQVFTVYKEDYKIGKDYSRFIDSFKLIDVEKNRVEPNGSKKLNVMTTPF